MRARSRAEWRGYVSRAAQIADVALRRRPVVLAEMPAFLNNNFEYLFQPAAVLTCELLEVDYILDQTFELFVMQF